jgi:hypothetical protein
MTSKPPNPRLSTIEAGIKLQRIAPGSYQGVPDPLFFNAANSAHGGYLLAWCGE